jgi:thioredoxin-related protein
MAQKHPLIEKFNSMKKILSAFFIILSVLSFAQEGIKFETSDFKTILAKAKKENKLIFLDAYTTWCGPCKLMAKNIFTLKTVGDHYNANFVNAKIDMEKGEGIDIAKKYDVKVFPTYLFIDGNGELVHRTVGYVPEKEFIQFAKDASDPSKRVAALKERFEKGEKDPEFLKNLVNLTAFTEADYAGKVFEQYITAKANTPLAADDMQMLFMTLKNSESPTYKIFKEKKADLLKFMPEKSYEATDKSLKINTVIKKAYNEESKTFDENKFIEGTKDFLTKDEAVKYLSKIKAGKALKDKDIATYEKLTLETYKDYTNFNSNELNSIAWNFFENVTNKSSLETALKWAQESVKQYENSANTDTLANLYNKLNDKANAKIWAEKAIELAKKNGEDASETQKLLDSLK